MEDFRKNKFQRAGRPDTKVPVESSWGTRLTNVRGGNRPLDVDNSQANPFARKEAARQAALADAPPVVEQTPVPTTRGGLRESPALTEARLAEEQRRRNVKAESERAAQPVLSNEDKLAILEAFKARHRDSKKPDHFWGTDFNVEQLHRAMAQLSNQGQVQWNMAGLEIAHDKLLKGGFYEIPNRIRGVWSAPEPLDDGNGNGKPVTVTKRADNDVPQAEPEPTRAELLALPFDELARRSRARNRRA
jgi:hypothetical protein